MFNFGGPGDPGAETLRGFVASVPRSIQDRYDLVSFDPRGTGGSRAIDCVSDKVADRLYAADPTPTTDAELRAFYDGTQGDVDFIAGCIAKNGSWLARVGSRNVARDLDRLRAALGSDRLNYLGYSYGTVIGSVYAQEFPERVGRMVLDGPVDFSADEAGDLDDATASFERALGTFLRHCAASDSVLVPVGRTSARCSAHATRPVRGRPDPPHVRTKRPAETRRAGVAAFYTGVLSSLYDKDFGWPNLADTLHFARHGDGTFLQLLADSYNGRRDDGTYDSLAESSGIIVCADQPDPLETYDQFVDEYHQAQKDFPFLGAYATDVPIGCDPRLPQPTEAEVLGDVRVSGVDPVLIVGTTGDPATPYHGAEELVRRIDDSRLLTFVSTEHTAYPKNACINTAVNDYLLSGRLPTRRDPLQALTAVAQRGTSFHGRSRDASGSFGSPSTRSPRMLRMMSDVPPSMVFACARAESHGRCRHGPLPPRDRTSATGAARSRPAPSHALPYGPSRSTASFWRRWLYVACWSFVIEPSGPTSAPVRRLSAARWLLSRIRRPSIHACAKRCRVRRSATGRWRAIKRVIELPPTASPPAEPAPESDTRSFISVVSATRHPSPSAPEPSGVGDARRR